MSEFCEICGTKLDDPNDRSTANCGGDCLRCIAMCGDPDCTKVMRELEPDNDAWKEWE